jgi:hypothetical protein
MGAQALLQPSAGSVPGARGALTKVGIGYLWEKTNSNVAFGLFLPIETDFGTRVALGPSAMLEVSGIFRVSLAPMFDIGPAFSFFFLRGELSFGWRNTGKRPKDDNTIVEGGVYFWGAFDYRIPNGPQLVRQEFRLVFGLRLEIGIPTPGEQDND